MVQYNMEMALVIMRDVVDIIIIMKEGLEYIEWNKFLNNKLLIFNIL